MPTESKEQWIEITGVIGENNPDITRKVTISQLQEGCRLCLCGEQQHIPLFSVYKNNMKYVEIAMLLADIEILTTDNLPKKICVECASNLILFYKFKKKCELSHATLTAILVNEAEKIQNDTENTNLGQIELELQEEGLEDEQQDIANQEKEIEGQDEDEQVYIEVFQQQIEEDEEEEVNVNLESVESADNENVEQEIIEIPSTENLNEISEEHCIIETIESNEQYDDHEYYFEEEIPDESIQDINKSSETNIIIDDNGQCAAKSMLITKISTNKKLKYKKEQQCNECSQIFSRKSTLIQHIKTHSGQKNFKCSVCQKFFTRKAHLQIHQRIHDKIKPYICPLCNRSFTKSSDLARHRRVHTDERNYACEQCQKRFKRSGDVITHMRVHTGERPYKCKICGKCYSSQSSLKKHLLNHDPVKKTNDVQQHKEAIQKED